MPDGGAIILNASIVATKGFADWSMYSAAKAAVRSFARTWTSDLKQRRIRVNAVSPGFTDTPAWHVNEAAEQRIPPFPKLSRTKGLGPPVRWRRLCCSSPPTTAATLPARSYSWMADSRRCESFGAARST
jgi:NAD(P)-dependent dehydrogenase (short-subunit alcohol dehydrogenase family)